MLEFNEERHEYKWQGAVVPSVTQILGSVGLCPQIPFKAQSREYFMKRGRIVHKATEIFDQGKLDKSSISEKVKPYLDGYEAFRERTGFVPYEIELLGSNQTWGYAGRIDRIGMIGQEFVLIDIKTGSAGPWVGPQLAAYANLEIKKDKPYSRRFALELPGDGKYKLIEYKSADDWKVFLSALSIYNWKKSNNVKIT